MLEEARAATQADRTPIANRHRRGSTTRTAWRRREAQANRASRRMRRILRGAAAVTPARHPQDATPSRQRIGTTLSDRPISGAVCRLRSVPACHGRDWPAGSRRPTNPGWSSGRGMADPIEALERFGQGVERRAAIAVDVDENAGPPRLAVGLGPDAEHQRLRAEARGPSGFGGVVTCCAGPKGYSAVRDGRPTPPLRCCAVDRDPGMVGHPAHQVSSISDRIGRAGRPPGGTWARPERTPAGAIPLEDPQATHRALPWHGTIRSGQQGFQDLGNIAMHRMGEPLRRASPCLRTDAGTSAPFGQGWPE